MRGKVLDHPVGVRMGRFDRRRTHASDPSGPRVFHLGCHHKGRYRFSLTPYRSTRVDPLTKGRRKKCVSTTPPSPTSSSSLSQSS